MIKDKIIFGIGIFISILVFSASGWLYYQNTKRVAYSVARIVETLQTPSPTQIPEINYDKKSDYKNTEILVLNGSGKAGVAKKYADNLKTLGYKKVEIGNYSEKSTTNLLMAPTNFKEDLQKIGFLDYIYKTSETIKVIIVVP